jgi:hypothetical protein
MTTAKSTSSKWRSIEVFGQNADWMLPGQAFVILEFGGFE